MRSQNGFPCPTNALTRKAQLKSYPVPGTRAQTVTLRRGSAGYVLAWWAGQWNAHVEPLAGNPHDEWGFASRDIRGSTTQVSNHASGTAIDLNAAEHPLGTRTLGAAKLARVEALLNQDVGGIRVGSVIRCGAFYTGRPDEMHAELNAPPKRVTALAHAIEASLKPKPPQVITPPTFLPFKAGDDMQQLYQVTGKPAIYLSDGIRYRWVRDMNDLRFTEARLKAAGAPTSVIDIHAAQVPSLGVLVGDAPK